jgi:hypothetical protein
VVARFAAVRPSLAGEPAHKMIRAVLSGIESMANKKIEWARTRPHRHAHRWPDLRDSPPASEQELRPDLHDAGVPRRGHNPEWAPGITAPLGSITVPEMVPVMLAKVRVVVRAKPAKTAAR